MAYTSRTFSPPPMSSAASSVAGGQHHLNMLSSRIVQKLAVEGRCQAEDQGASLRLFMKIVLPLEGLVGGSSIPLFPEESVRIVNSKVHPLDSNSTPYAFSSTATPLLHKAARALGLPARSKKSYYTFLGIPPPSPPSGPISSPAESSTSRRTAAAAPLPISVTGEINVSNFQICFILPRILPTRGAVLADADLDQTPRSNRRGSFVDRNTILFMAGVDIFIPFASRPPKAPYLLSLPLPRCLSNHIKLRIMPPAKLPSGQDPPPWDLSCEPMVTYKPSHGSRSTSYEQLADDEISLSDSVESSTNASPHGIQGSFPSTERIRIRWAAPMNRNQGLGVLADGRRRVGVEEGVGLLRCTLVSRDAESRTKVRLEYEGTCKGLWFPGVATQVGLDVVLDGKGRALSWASEDERWEINGGVGLTGFDSALQEAPIEPSPQLEEPPSLIPRPAYSKLSSYAAPSLLRTPLPNTSLLPDYSFETTPSPTVSMIASTGTPYGSSTAGSVIIQNKAPTTPVTLFLNIGDLPPTNNEFNFKVSGTILLGPPKEGDAEEGEDDTFELPVFRILPAEKTRTEVIVSSELHHHVELILPQEKRRNGAIGTRTPPPRRKVLKRRVAVRADDGVSVIISSVPFDSPRDSPMTPGRGLPATPMNKGIHTSPRTPRTPRANPTTSPMIGSYPIPWVRTTVTMLPLSKQHSHVVQFSVPPVAVTDGILSFGVCIPHSLSNGDDSNIEVVSATADGMNLEVEVFPRIPTLEEDQRNVAAYDRTSRLVDFNTASTELHKEEMGDLALKDIESWVRVILPDERISGPVEVQYLVGREPAVKGKQRGNSRAEQLSILLPSFHMGIGTYTVDFHTPRGYSEPLLLSNFHQQENNQLSHYRLPAYFYPRVRAQIEKIGSSAPTLPMRSLMATGWLMRRMLEAIPALASLAMLWLMITIREDIRDMRFFSSLPLASGWASTTRPETFQQPQPGGPAPTTTATFPYTVDTASATPYNPQPSGNTDMDIARQAYSLMPLPLALLPRLDWGRLTDALLVSMEKLLGVLKYMLHFPAPP